MHGQHNSSWCSEKISQKKQKQEDLDDKEVRVLEHNLANGSRPARLVLQINYYLHIILYNICVKYMFNSELTCEQYKEMPIKFKIGNTL